MELGAVGAGLGFPLLAGPFDVAAEFEDGVGEGGKGERGEGGQEGRE